MVHEVADRLEQAGLLTQRQAEVYFITQIAGRHRTVAATRLGISESAVDDHLRRARSNIRAARRTLDLLDDTGGEAVGKWQNQQTKAGETDDSDHEPQGSDDQEGDQEHDSWGLSY